MKKSTQREKTIAQENLEVVIEYFGSQSEFARKMDISRMTVNNWLKGREVISCIYACKIENLTRKKFRKESFLSAADLAYLLQKNAA